MPRGKRILCAYLWRRSWNVQTVAVDNRLCDSFLWHRLGDAYIKVGDPDAAIKVYDMAIKVYEAALGFEGSGLDELLLLIYEPDGGNFHGFMSASRLPESVMWSALGGIYKAKGEVHKSMEAFRKALQLEPDNPWLLEMVV
jgi:tetratricopeptide (TPR) repeat protein